MLHGIEVELVESSVVAMVKTTDATDTAKVELTPLSQNSIKRRIELILKDILTQLIVTLKIKRENFLCIRMSLWTLQVTPN